jgi:hypothetical protein
MPSFVVTAHSTAPVEEVWKLLHDPTTFPDWWAGIETVERDPTDADAIDYTMWPDGYPDFPMGQRLTTTPSGVTISCLVSDLVFRWRLTVAGSGTAISAEVEIPEREAHRLPVQRDLLRTSVSALAALAAR